MDIAYQTDYVGAHLSRKLIDPGQGGDADNLLGLIGKARTLVMIHSILNFLFRLLNVFEWHDIATAPFHQEIELAIIDDRIRMSALTYLRETNGWLDAENLRPVSVAATHWRYRQPVFALSCC